jgi:hypothetical protein
MVNRGKEYGFLSLERIACFNKRESKSDKAIFKDGERIAGP